MRSSSLLPSSRSSFHPFHPLDPYHPCSLALAARLLAAFSDFIPTLFRIFPTFSDLFRPFPTFSDFSRAFSALFGSFWLFSKREKSVGGLDEWGAEKSPGAPEQQVDCHVRQRLRRETFQMRCNTGSPHILPVSISSDLVIAHPRFVFLPATTKLRPPQATGGTSHPR